jgi:tRNA-dihydrouridine synthase
MKIMKSFWEELPKPFFVLAPMEAVTDIVFRQVVAKASRPDIFFTEFVNATSFCSEKGYVNTKSRLEFLPSEKPIVAQIWGNKPAEFAQMSQSLAKMNFSGIDINMGCPERSVVHSGCGSGLIRTPQLAGDLIAATKTSGLPVSVKTRLGDNQISQWREWLSFLFSQDVTNLTIHLRTRKEMSKVPAHYELIPEIIKMRDEIAPKTLLTINGDIQDRQQGLELFKQYGVNGLMIGRGVFQNPFAFAQDQTPRSRDDLLALLRLQLDLHDQYSINTPRKFDPLKHFFKIYIRDFSGASELRERLMQTKTTAEVRQIIDQLD